MRTFSILILFFFTLSLSAQNGAPPVAGARGAAMGGTGVTFTDLNSAFRNQAGLAFLENMGGLVVGERRFLDSPVNALSAAAAYPSEFGTFGLTLNYFGIDAFNEQKIGIAYARQLFDNLSIGVQFDYLNTQIQEYGSAGAITFEAGLYSKISDVLALAMHVYSPARIEWTAGENLPSIFTIGLAYQPSNKVMVTAEAEKDIDFDTRFRGGVEYFVLEKVWIRAGAATNPTNVTFGLGYAVSEELNIDIASVYHQYLGITPSIAVVYHLSSKT